MAESIIDAEKLQKDQFIKKDWLVKANQIKMMIIFNVTEKDIKNSVAHYNKLGKIQGVVYSYKPITISIINEEG